MLGDTEMNSNPAHVAQVDGRRTALRTLVLGTAAAILAGCYTAHEALLDSIPNDYRQRHPIVLKEAPRTVELFIGNRRGSLDRRSARRRALLRAGLAARRHRRRSHRRAVRHAQ